MSKAPNYNLFNNLENLRKFEKSDPLIEPIYSFTLFSFSSLSLSNTHTQSPETRDCIDGRVNYKFWNRKVCQPKIKCFLGSEWEFKFIRCFLNIKIRLFRFIVSFKSKNVSSKLTKAFNYYCKKTIKRTFDLKIMPS
jgi:hypothetical protein